MMKAVTAAYFAILVVTLPVVGMTQDVPYDCQNVPRPVDVAAQPMSKAVAELSKQVQCPISISSDAGAITSRAIKGNLTPIAAGIMMVQGTGLEATPIRQGLMVGRYEQDLLDKKVATLALKVHDAVKAGRITAARGASLRRALNGTTASAHRLARQQGFVSAAEKASYKRTLDAVAKSLS